MPASPLGMLPAPSRPFSRFTDVAHSAGLTAAMFYGTPQAVTYITEEMGGGCAFFDYDNDGWMDIFILGGRRLDDIPAGASNRLYKTVMRTSSSPTMAATSSTTTMGTEPSAM